MASLELREIGTLRVGTTGSPATNRVADDVASGWYFGMSTLRRHTQER